MTVVLVHGNPETDAIWGPLVDALGRDDAVRLSPLGFGARCVSWSQRSAGSVGWCPGPVLAPLRVRQ